MFTRTITKKLKELALKYPSIAILGPRQSGKSTLSKLAFPNYVYLSLEDRSVRERAALDPKGFIEFYQNTPGIILDEFQRLPELLSYIQLAIDEKYRPGHFILTGSQNFLMNEKISQSLAGRITILTLLPLSITELKENQLVGHQLVDQSVGQLVEQTAPQAEKTIFYGCYPRIYDQHLDPTRWYNDYIETYVEKDIKQLTTISDLDLFRKFVGLCAGRIGQTLDFTSLSDNCGISVPTVKRWLSLLQASYVLFLLQPYHNNFGKRLTKSPKLYFYDTGLACALLGIESETQLATHYLRGGLFESFIIADIIKELYNQAERPHVYFWQETGTNEIDCIIEKADKRYAVEIKSGQTISKNFFKTLRSWSTFAQTPTTHNFLVYTGTQTQPWPDGTVIGWLNISDLYAILKS